MTAQVIRCFEQCRRGEFPDHPMGNGACNTLFDPTYAPAGKHVAFWWPFAPYALPDGPEGWDRRRKEYTERLLDVWRGYAPNLGSDVLAAHLYTPLDLERRIPNMVRGAVRMGAYVPSQLGINRPRTAGRLSRGSTCAGRPATEAASTALPATTPPTPSPPTSGSRGRGRRCRRRSGRAERRRRPRQGRPRRGPPSAASMSLTRCAAECPSKSSGHCGERWRRPNHATGVLASVRNTSA